MKPTTILTGILILLLYDNVQCELVTKPTNAVIANGSVIMKCSSNNVNDICDNIMWMHYKPNSRTGLAINTGNELKADFNSYIAIIDTTAGNCNLKIDAKLWAAGTYKCVDLSNGEESSAELIIIDADYRIKWNVCECFAYYFGNRAHIMQWMESNGNDWTRVDSTISLGYQQYISVTTLTPNQPITCNINVSAFGKLYTYDWHKPAEGTTTTTATQQITTTRESLSVTCKVNTSLSGDPKGLSDANNESASGNQGLSVAVVVGIAIGVAIVSVLVTLLIVILIVKKKKSSRN